MTPWIVAYQVPPSMGFSRQEYWSGLPFRSPITICIYICVCVCVCVYKGFLRGSVVKNLPANLGNTGDGSLIPGLG